MAEDGGRTASTTPLPWDGELAAALVQEVLSVIPVGCTWLLPVTADGQIVDFRIAAASDRRRDIYGRGVTRVDARLSQLYPSMLDGPLWQLYHEVMATGVPGHLADFEYEEKRAGVVAHSLLEVSGLHAGRRADAHPAARPAPYASPDDDTCTVALRVLP